MTKEMELSPETKNAQALRQIDTMTGGLMPAIQPSSTYVRDENYQLINARHSYGRDENPGYAIAEKVLAELLAKPEHAWYKKGFDTDVMEMIKAEQKERYKQ